MLNHQRLECYQKGVRLVKELASLMPNWPGRATLKDQAERAATSAILNLAEGCGKPTPKDRRKFFAISRGSIQEFSACMDIAHAPARISHSLSTTTRDMPVILGVLVNRSLDRLYSMPRVLIPAFAQTDRHLMRFATKLCEKCGLGLISKTGTGSLAFLTDPRDEARRFCLRILT